MRKKIIIINTLLVLIFFNYSIYSQERNIDNGKTVLFALAPYDPRSLMQGDYMDLRYEIEDIIENTENYRENTEAVLKLNKESIAEFDFLNGKNTKLAENEILLTFRIVNGEVQLPLTSSYFFEEGSAKIFENAKYGVFKYHNNRFTLIHLANEDKKIIEE